MLQHNVLTILLGVKLRMESSNMKNKSHFIRSKIGLVHMCVCVGVCICVAVTGGWKEVMIF